MASRVYLFPSLLSGRRASPALAQHPLAMHMVEASPSGVVQYMDNILIMGPQDWKIREQTRALVHILQEAGCVISKKSVVKPRRDTTWMGKKLHGVTHTISSTGRYLTSVALVSPKLAAMGYNQIVLCRLQATMVGHTMTWGWFLSSGHLCMAAQRASDVKMYAAGIDEVPHRRVCKRAVSWRAPTPREESLMQLVDAATRRGAYRAATWNIHDPPREVRQL